MNAVRQGDGMNSEDAQRAVESLRIKQDSIYERVIKLEAKDEQKGKEIADVCIQLKATDNRLTKHIDSMKTDLHSQIESLSKKLDPLIEDYQQRLGQKKVASWVPIVLQTIVLSITIIAAIKVGAP